MDTDETIVYAFLMFFSNQSKFSLLYFSHIVGWLSPKVLTQRTKMKRLSLIAMALVVSGLVACNQASAGGSFNQQARLDSLEKDFKQVKEEFEIIKYAFDKRGISLEQARAEMEADNKVWDIPDEDSPVFGNTKDPKLTIVEFTEF